MDLHATLSDQSLPPAPPEHAGEESRLFPSGQGWPVSPDIVRAVLDLAKDRQPPLSEQLDVGPDGRGQTCQEWQAPKKKLTGPIDLEAHELGKGPGVATGQQVLVAVAELASIFVGKVDPPNVQVAGDILPEVRQLQTRTDAI